MAQFTHGFLFSDKTISDSGICLTKTQVKIIRNNYYPQQDILGDEGVVLNLYCGTVLAVVCSEVGVYYYKETAKGMVPRKKRIKALKDLTVQLIGHAFKSGF